MQVIARVCLFCEPNHIYGCWVGGTCFECGECEFTECQVTDNQESSHGVCPTGYVEYRRKRLWKWN